jgi:ParB family chromosome partitioning protein
MMLQELPISDIDISEFNTRKDLIDGQSDSTIDDLARSIERQGLLSPITVYRRPDCRYALIAGQRRYLACRKLGMTTISAVVRDTMEAADATAISLVENVHRADMNPRDKAIAFKTLHERFGDLHSVSRETGVGISTIRRYIQLLNLATEIQQKLAAGEAKNTEALAKLAQTIADPEKQVEVWDQISGFTQDVQQEIIKRVTPDLENLGELVDSAAEGAFGYRVVRNCPYDCSTVPAPLKEQVANMIRAFHSQGLSDVVGT